MYNLYFFPERSGTYSITRPETARSLVPGFGATGWTLNIDAIARREDAFDMILTGGGTLNVTAQSVSTLFLTSVNVYAEPIPTGTAVVHGDVETLIFYNSNNSERIFTEDTTI